MSPCFYASNGRTTIITAFVVVVLLNWGDVPQQLGLINAFRANPCTYVYAAEVPGSASPVAPISRNLLNLDNVIDLDLRLTKVLAFSEHHHLELFFEGYNNSAEIRT